MLIIKLFLWSQQQLKILLDFVVVTIVFSLFHDDDVVIFINIWCQFKFYKFLFVCMFVCKLNCLRVFEYFCLCVNNWVYVCVFLYPYIMLWKNMKKKTLDAMHFTLRTRQKWVHHIDRLCFFFLLFFFLHFYVFILLIIR